MSNPASRCRESPAGVLLLIVVPTAAWAVALAVIFADRLRPLLAAFPSP
ncbi:MAG: hypothetical protein OXP70_08980 [Acidobacteriota bacterium]|nr:hypothetical protein [Acidobacteriota bacterium]